MTYRQPFAGDYPITQKYGEIVPGVTYGGKPHTGIDYGCPISTQILASEDGTVGFAGWDSTGYGLCVIIQHTNDRSTLYAHLNRIFINTGDNVKQGQPIALSGASGNATGPHLHFEARHIWNDYTTHFDPMDLPLMSVSDAPPHHTEQQTLKDADAFQAGEHLHIVAPAGAWGWSSNFSKRQTVFPDGTELIFTGKTIKRLDYTYCEVYPEPVKYWVAVHDGKTQILDQ